MLCAAMAYGQMVVQAVLRLCDTQAWLIEDVIARRQERSKHRQRLGLFSGSTWDVLRRTLGKRTNGPKGAEAWARLKVYSSSA
jgi:hypothetical protein